LERSKQPNRFGSCKCCVCFGVRIFCLLFFTDPEAIAKRSIVLPEDINSTLNDIAGKAADYKIFVRTGRHFRAKILPILVKRAREKRLPIRIEVVLLDIRNLSICEKYAHYRSASSFDHKLWDINYVRTEVVSTILSLIQSSRENPGLIEVQLFLSQRLSSFRIEGSSDEILVTREDPKDTASRYFRTDRDFGAFVTEFTWIRDEAFCVAEKGSREIPKTLSAIFGVDAEITKLGNTVSQAMNTQSPYVR